MDFQLFTFQADNNAPEDQVFPISLSARINFEATIGTPFPLYYFLRLDTRGGTTFDFLSTARLSLDLPAGVSATSTGGFTTAVPEPDALALFAIGLLSVTALGRMAGRGSYCCRPLAAASSHRRPSPSQVFAAPRTMLTPFDNKSCARSVLTS